MTTHKSKIARLPHSIREQLNQRLQDGHDARQLMDWLGMLPEVQAVLDQHFDGDPINPVNLTKWRQGGFREWQHEQLALSLVDNLEDETALGQKELTGDLTARLARWIAIHLAASAQAMVAYEEDPKLRWARLGDLCNRLARLRRGDLSSQRLSHERLELEKLNTDEEREKAFWEWTKRPDIHEKLFPDKQKGLSPETLAKIEHELKLM